MTHLNLQPDLATHQWNRHIGAWRLSGKFGALRLEGRRFETHSSRRVGTEFLNRCVATRSAVCHWKLVCQRCITKKWCVAIRKSRKTQCQDQCQYMICPNLSRPNQALVPSKLNRHLLNIVIDISSSRNRTS